MKKRGIAIGKPPERKLQSQALKQRAVRPSKARSGSASPRKKRPNSARPPATPSRIPSHSVESAYDSISAKWDESRTRPHQAFPFFEAEFLRRHRSLGRVCFARVLDAGCGNGRNAAAFLSRFLRSRVDCADISAGMLASASRNLCRRYAHRVSFAKADLAAGLPYASNCFDAAMCFAVLHHLKTGSARLRGLAEICRVLKPGSFAFVTVWVRSDCKKDCLVPFSLGNKKSEPRYYHFFSKKELESLCRRAGLAVSDSFYEDRGKKVGASHKSRTKNLCLVLQKRVR